MFSSLFLFDHNNDNTVSIAFQIAQEMLKYCFMCCYTYKGVYDSKVKVHSHTLFLFHVVCMYLWCCYSEEYFSSMPNTTSSFAFLCVPNINIIWIEKTANKMKEKNNKPFSLWDWKIIFFSSLNIDRNGEISKNLLYFTYIKRGRAHFRFRYSNHAKMTSLNRFNGFKYFFSFQLFPVLSFFITFYFLLVIVCFQFFFFMDLFPFRNIERGPRIEVK